MAILVVVPNSMWVLAILWLDLSYAVGSVRAAGALIPPEVQSGLMTGDDSIIDYSMQFGSFDVGVSLPAACSSAAFPVVSAPAVAAFPFPSCGLALSAELRLYPVYCFQPWNVDCVICYLSPEMVFSWIFMGSWSLDDFSWTQSGALSRLMANHGGHACGARVCCSQCRGFLGKPVCYAVALALEEIGNQEVLQAVAARAAANSDHDAHTFLATSVAQAFEGLHCVVTQQAAGARAAAFFVHGAHAVLVTSAARALEGLHVDTILQAAAASAAAYLLGVALSSLVTSAAGAFDHVCKVFRWQAAVASAAAFFLLVHMFESCWIFAGMLLFGLWEITGLYSSTIGMGKTQKSEELKDFHDFSVPQASIQEAVILYDAVDFDEHDEFKGKDRHGTDGSLSLGFGEASGRVDVPVSADNLIDAAFRSPQSVVVNQSLRVEKTIFMKGLDGRTTIHRVSDDMMIGEILDDWLIGLDVMISFNGKVIGMNDTVGELGIERDCTLRCSGRVRGGAQRYRQPDIPGQWTCSVCFQDRVWPVRNRCFRCGAPRGHDPAPSVPPYVVGPTGRPPQRSNPVNPTYRPNQKQQQPMVPSASVQSFPPLNQPVPTGRVETSGTGGVPAFPAGNLDWLKNFLQEILSPEDYLKYKSSFDPTPQKEEVPLALQLANKTKERGSVLAQIERERVLVADFKAKYAKHTETLTELMERKYSLQREIEELEMLSTAAEEKQHVVPVEPVAPGPPQTPQPVGPRESLPGPPPLVEETPHDEEDDESMEPGDIPGAGVGFNKPLKRKADKAAAVKRVVKGAFSKGRRSSLIVKAATLSTHDLVLLQEQVTKLSNSRQKEDTIEVQDDAERRSEISATDLEPSASLG